MAAKDGLRQAGLMTDTDPHLARYHEQGFVILRDVLDATEIEALRAAETPQPVHYDDPFYTRYRDPVLL